MTRLRVWAPFAVLLALALAAGLAAGSDDAASDLPSAENAGPRGLKVLKTWLTESGADVRTSAAPLTALPAGLATVVLAAPVNRRVDAEEIAALLAFVDRGGTLIYLAPRDRPQRALDLALGVRKGELPPTTTDFGGDLGGATATVRFPGGLAAGASALRVSADTVVTVEAEGAVPVTSPAALWRVPRGKGEVWVGAGADLAENSRLELLDNAAFWANAGARGPLLFDEGHHLAAVATPVTLNLWATLLQFSLCALVFVAARGARLGPARPTPERVHREALEYVRAMAALTRDARREPELVLALRRNARTLLHERLGLAPTLPGDELLRQVERHTERPASTFRPLVNDADFLETSRALATLEAALDGRR